MTDDIEITIPETDVPETASEPTEAPPPADEWTELPKSWRREMQPHWGKLPAEVRKYVYEREKQALDGLMHYKSQLDPFSQVLKRHEQFLSQAGLPAHEIFDRALTTHVGLLHGDEATKRALLQEMVNFYQLGPLLGQQASDRAFSELQTRLEAQERAMRELLLRDAQSKVDAFLASPEKEFAKEVVSDMAQLLKSGLAKDLEEAYNLAIWQNPSTRAKLLEREVTKATTARASPPRPVKSGAAPGVPTKPPAESMEETLARVYEEVTQRS